MLQGDTMSNETKLIKGKCTECGGILDVDASKDAMICSYCNTPYIVEKAIKNYNIDTLKIENSSNLNISLDSHVARDTQLLHSALAYIKIGDYDLASQLLNSIIYTNANNIQIWEGLLICLTCNYTKLTIQDEDLNTAEHYANCACTIADKNLACMDHFQAYREQVLEYRKTLAKNTSRLQTLKTKRSAEVTRYNDNVFLNGLPVLVAILSAVFRSVPIFLGCLVIAIIACATIFDARKDNHQKELKKIDDEIKTLKQWLKENAPQQ
jgi:tetratricopeptide (TPR) repeat protein